MAIQEFNMFMGYNDGVLANGNAGRIWPKNPIYISPDMEGLATCLVRPQWQSWSLINIAPAYTNTNRTSLQVSGALPTYTPNSCLAPSSGSLCGLVGPNEIVGQTALFAIKNKIPASANVMWAHTLSFGGTTGWDIFQQTAVFQGIKFSSKGLIDVTVNNTGIAQDVYLIIGVAHGSNFRRAYIRGLYYQETSGSYLPSTNPVTGMNNYNTAWSQNQELTQMAVYPFAFSGKSQFDAYADRMAAVCTAENQKVL